MSSFASACSSLPYAFSNRGMCAYIRSGSSIVGGFEPGHLRELALGEEEGDLGAQAGVAVGDSL